MSWLNTRAVTHPFSYTPRKYIHVSLIFENHTFQFCMNNIWLCFVGPAWCWTHQEIANHKQKANQHLSPKAKIVIYHQKHLHQRKNVGKFISSKFTCLLKWYTKSEMVISRTSLMVDNILWVLSLTFFLSSSTHNPYTAIKGPPGLISICFQTGRSWFQILVRYSGWSGHYNS